MDGISLSHLFEVLKVLNFVPQVISKQDMHSLLVQSQTLHDVLSYSEFIYFHFLLFTVAEDKLKIFEPKGAGTIPH